MLINFVNVFANLYNLWLTDVLQLSANVEISMVFKSILLLLSVVFKLLVTFLRMRNTLKYKYINKKVSK